MLYATTCSLDNASWSLLLQEELDKARKEAAKWRQSIADTFVGVCQQYVGQLSNGLGQAQPVRPWAAGAFPEQAACLQPAAVYYLSTVQTLRMAVHIGLPFS